MSAVGRFHWEMLNVKPGAAAVVRKPTVVRPSTVVLQALQAGSLTNPYHTPCSSRRPKTMSMKTGEHGIKATQQSCYMSWNRLNEGRYRSESGTLISLICTTIAFPKTHEKEKVQYHRPSIQYHSIIKDMCWRDRVHMLLSSTYLCSKPLF